MEFHGVLRGHRFMNELASPIYAELGEQLNMIFLRNDSIFLAESVSTYYKETRRGQDTLSSLLEINPVCYVHSEGETGMN